MTQQTKVSIITALAPAPEPLDPEWSQATLAGILSPMRTTTPRRSKGRRRALVGIAAAALSLGTATAVAVGGPTDVVDHVLTQFGEQPNTSGNGLELHDPQLVAQFETERGIFALWIATGSPGEVCYALSDGQWNGEGNPTKDQLEYGCGGQIWVGPGRPVEELTRPDQFGGFFKDDDGPMVYGVSPYPGTAEVRVQANGVDRTLPVRPDSLGYGSALPEAEQVPAVTLTFLDAAGRELGSKRSIAPVG
jgi:hypothetical protein